MKADSPTSLSDLLPSGMNSTAVLKPFVIVPVLSRRSESVSPAASIALPDFIMTLFADIRFIPDIPIAGRSAPIVVGKSET
jgi:hypothetical protein